MIVAGIACLVHAVVPGFFAKTGSAAIERLHGRMVLNRRRVVGATPAVLVSGGNEPA